MTKYKIYNSERTIYVTENVDLAERLRDFYSNNSHEVNIQEINNEEANRLEREINNEFVLSIMKRLEELTKRK